MKYAAAILGFVVLFMLRAWGFQDPRDPAMTFESVDKRIAAGVRADIKSEMRRIERFVGQRFPSAFEVQLCPDRAAFDVSLKKYAGIPQSEKWMVGMGTAERLVLLSPRVWQTEATDHDPRNAGHVRRLIGHELVHVFHGQCCPKPDFDGMDELAWFIEGLATCVSGQVEAEHKSAARDVVAAGKGPTLLADAWQGRYRYGVCGSLCWFVEVKWGRETNRKLLRSTTNREALELLRVPESELLNRWRDWATSSAPKSPAMMGPSDIDPV